MEDAGAKVIDLIFGRKRSQMLYVGVTLGVFDALAHGPRSAVHVASVLDVDADLLYRLMRALGALELLHEDDIQDVLPDADGRRCSARTTHIPCAGSPCGKKGRSLALWKHLPALITEGQQNAFVREFGQPAFAYMAQHPSVGAVFNEAMSSYSSIDTRLVLEALEPYGFSGIAHLCDVGGGYGHTLCSLLGKYPAPDRDGAGTAPRDRQARAVVGRQDERGRAMCLRVWGHVQEVPPADAYMVKRVLHDWNDVECHQILSTIHRAAPQQGRVWIIEHIVPGADTPHVQFLMPSSSIF